MMNKLRQLLSDRRAVAAVEFALVAPIVIVLLVSTIRMGIYFFAQNSIDNALDETARAASVYPSPSDSALQQIFADNLLKREVGVQVYMNITRGESSSGIDYVDLSSRYMVPVDLIFWNLGNIPVNSEQRAYLPPA